MKKKILSVLLCLCMVMALLPTTALAASTNISTFAELQTAFSNGGEYTLTQNITVTAQLTLVSGKTLTIHGNGHTIQPAVTGLNEQGVVNGDATAIENIIKINSSGILTLDNLTIYGGKGRCIYNYGTLTMTGVSLERAHLTGEYGAGLYNSTSSAKACLTNCNIRRNGCDLAGGGFRNNGTLIMENCAIVENRNFGSSTGGGGGENRETLYMNNCTVANNQSSEIGGGLNNYGGTAYIMNSTFTGNVTTASEAHAGGGIGYNGGKVYAVNSVFAFNYANGDVSDIGIWSGTDVNLYYCAYGAIVKSDSTTEPSARDTCKKLTGEVSALFNGARTSGIVDKDGKEQNTTFARPVITQSGSTYGVYPAESSALKTGGTKTYYDRTGFTVKMSYDSGSTNTALGDPETASTAENAVLRPGGGDTSGLIGALPANITIKTMYTVKVNPATGGTVTGGSAQGNSYPADTTNIQITAVPNAGYTFSGWKVGADESISSTANPYTIDRLTEDVTLTPVFALTPYSISLSAGSNPLTSHTFTEATVGYATAPEALTVTVTNTGTAATGGLTVALSGPNDDSFILSKTTINSIADTNGTDTFTVQPTTGLNAGTYTATVTVSNTEHSISASFNVSFTVNPVTYTVTVNPGANMTKTGGSGAASQTVTDGSPMTNVVYTANDGYYFPTDYSVAAQNGISVTRDRYTQITVSGTPTAAVNLTLADATAKTPETTPSARFAAESENGGKLTGVDSTMKYSVDGGSSWLDITGDNMVITNVTTANGVQVKKSASDANTKLDSDAQTITVTKAATPNLAATQPSTVGGKGSIPTTAEHEFSSTSATSGFSACTGTTSDLAAGTYYVRVKASGAVLASDAQTITITAYVAPSSGGSYTPPTYKVESEVTESTDGNVSFSKGSAKKGDTVTITVTPDRYYKVDGVTVKDKNGNEIAVTDNGDGTFTFKMPASKVTVEPVFSWDNPFADVAENAYYAPAVEWALKNDITDGVDAAHFAPNASCTRAQIVTFLWRAAGCPAPKSSTMPFTDVKAGSYYETAVLWAVENGITKGTGDTTFSPNATCSRAQIVSFLYRAASSPAVSGSAVFTDVSAGSYYANAVAWAVENGITGGTGNNAFSPNADCTRAQIVSFLYRWMVK